MKKFFFTDSIAPISYEVKLLRFPIETVVKEFEKWASGFERVSGSLCTGTDTLLWSYRTFCQRQILKSNKQFACHRSSGLGCRD